MRERQFQFLEILYVDISCADVEDIFVVVIRQTTRTCRVDAFEVTLT